MSFSEETAVVSYIDDSYAYLMADSVSACSTCSAKATCGAKTITSSNYKLRVKNTESLLKGDLVVLSMKSQKLIIATAMIYIFPLIMLFIFAYLGKIISGELASAIGGLVGLFGGLILISKFINKNQVFKYFEPQIIRVIRSNHFNQENNKC